MKPDKMHLQPPVGTPVFLRDILRSLLASYENGRLLKKISRVFSELTGMKYNYFVSSGRDALYIILEALKTINKRREIIIPAYTCPSVALTANKAGLKVILSDISIKTLNMDRELLEKIITDSCLCVVPAHMFGFPCDMPEIVRIAKNLGVFVVEDCAQALGASYAGQMVGSFGDFGFFSLGLGKNITTGQGGIIATNSMDNASIIEKILANKKRNTLGGVFSNLSKVTAYSFFIRPQVFYFLDRFMIDSPEATLNPTPQTGLFSNFQCALGLYGLMRLKDITEKRRLNAEYLTRHLNAGNSLSVPLPPAKGRAVYLRLPILLDDKEKREKIFKNLYRKGIKCGILYERPLDFLQIEYEISKSVQDVAEKVRRRVLALPTHHFLTKKSLDKMIQTIHDSVGVSKR